jgi:hypothetical protein
MARNTNVIPTLTTVEKPVGFSADALLGVDSVNLDTIDPIKYARDYSLSCYPPDRLYDDEQRILKIIVDRQNLVGDCSRLLDIGSASVISYATALAKRIKEIHMADIIDEHLELISEWVRKDPNARSWQVHTSHVLTLEGVTPTDADIHAREDSFRKKLTTLLRGDLCESMPLGRDLCYPVVSCFYASEQAAANCPNMRYQSAQSRKEKWFDVMRNLANLVEPGGFLVMSIVHNSDFYVINDQNGIPSKINIANVTIPDVLNALKDGGFDLGKSLITEETPDGLSDEGISKIIVMHAKKI